MGGRLAEEIVFKEKTNGASNDIERATEIAKMMVCRWGMSERVGPVAFGPKSDMPFVGMGSESKDYSESKAKEIDEEVTRIIQDNYKVAKDILESKREQLERLAEALIVWETLDRAQVLDIVKGKDIGVPISKQGGGTSAPVVTEEKETSEGSNPIKAGPQGGVVPA